MAIVALALSPTAASARPGALDRSFGTNGRVATQTSLGSAGWEFANVHVAEGPGGTIVAASGNTVLRYLPEGKLDPSFGEGGRLKIAEPEGLLFTLHDLAVDQEGRVVLFGDVEIADVSVLFDYMGGEVHPRVAAVIRYERAGQLDATFGGGDGFVVTDFEQSSYGSEYDRAFTSATRGRVDANGNLILIGSVTEPVTPCYGHSSLGAFTRLIVRLTPTGGLDSSFGGGDGVKTDTSIEAIDDLALANGDEPTVVGTGGGSCSESGSYAVVRLKGDGDADLTFGRNGSGALPSSPPGKLAIDDVGRVVVLSGRQVVRLTPSGKLDRRFGYRGETTVRLPGESRLSTLAVEASGGIVLIGTQAVGAPGAKPGGVAHRRSFTAIRLNPLGHLDRRFGHQGWFATRFGKDSKALGQSAFIDESGRLVIGGPVASPELAPTGGIALARYRLGR